MKYSYTCDQSLRRCALTWDMVTMDCFALAMLVSPQTPMIFLSCIILR